MLMSKALGARSRIAPLVVALALVASASSDAAATTSGGWSNLGHGATASQPAINGKVYAFTSARGKLYVGGQFTNAGGLAAGDDIAVWNGSAWTALGAGITDGAVYAIAVDGNDVYVGGSFSNAGGVAAADGLAKWDGTSWSAIANRGFSLVLAMTIIGRKLFVAGGFQDADGIAAADGVAAYGLDSHAWSALTAHSGDITGTIGALAPDGTGGLYAGGYFANLAGIAAADYIAHWTGGTSWSALGSGLNGRVWGLAVNSAAVYASGEFTNAGGVDAADKIASFSGGTWSPVGTSSAFGDGANAIYGIALDGQTVFAVGGFLNADGRPRLDGIAAFWYGSWRNVGTDAAGTNGPASGQMRAIQVLGNRLYVGGLDTAIGGGALNEGVASYLLRQPDAVIGPSLGDYVGDHIFNATGKGQTLKLKVARNGTGTFVIGLYNDGFATESFTAKGGASGHGFRAAYSAGPDDITAQVTAGTYVTYSLPPGAFDVIFLKVHVARSVAPGASRSFLVTETSPGPGHAKDAVKAVVTVR